MLERPLKSTNVGKIGGRIEHPPELRREKRAPRFAVHSYEHARAMMTQDM
ncbi:hypothetical protein ACWJKU_02015 [Methylocaldum sp. MU1018]